ncbi:MAG: hypothetical protein WC521_07460 [Bdellovibrionales bacterium]|jgi:hypothetical protein
MNTKNNPNRLRVVPQTCLSGFHKPASRRSGDLRSVIHGGNVVHMTQSIQESVARTFNEIFLEEPTEPDECA